MWKQEDLKVRKEEDGAAMEMWFFPPVCAIKSPALAAHRPPHRPHRPQSFCHEKETWKHLTVGPSALLFAAS